MAIENNTIHYELIAPSQYRFYLNGEDCGVFNGSEPKDPSVSATAWTLGELDKQRFMWMCAILKSNDYTISEKPRKKVYRPTNQEKTNTSLPENNDQVQTGTLSPNQELQSLKDFKVTAEKVTVQAAFVTFLVAQLGIIYILS